MSKASPKNPATSAAATQPVDPGDLYVRFSSLPIRDVLKIRMKELGVTNRDLQAALGYTNPNVIAMMRTGTMRLPPAKAVIAAKVLEVDPAFLLGKAIAESDPELWKTISETLGQQMVTHHEHAVIQYLRKALKGHDVNLLASASFTQILAPVLADIFKHEAALAAAKVQAAGA